MAADTDPNAPTLIRFALAQINPTVGDLEANRALCEEAITAAQAKSADVIVFPELALTGYPPEDLLLVPRFIAAAEEELKQLARAAAGSVVLIGAPESIDGELYNSLAVLADGEIRARYRKVHLPNYGVFDEQRYFKPGEKGETIRVNGVTIGLSICEDIWVPGSPSSDCAAGGASVLINISASPFHTGKVNERRELIAQRTAEIGIPIAYCALVGGQDELVFDGGSMVIDGVGNVATAGALFSEDLVIWDYPHSEQSPHKDLSHANPIADLQTGADGGRTLPTPEQPVRGDLTTVQEVERALELGLRDYVEKNGFGGVVLGVSGGIDSAVTAAIAVEALGADCVHGVVMPSPWSSNETQNDARDLCENLGISCLEFAIVDLMKAYDDVLAQAPQGSGRALAEENIQARIRGNLLMALSNEHGWLVLTTGNKSELAVGYSTLYGDAAGGFGPIKDTPKTLVFELARHLREERGLNIPVEIIERPPSAELRPDQLDTDSLPPYDILDPILRMYVEEHLDSSAIVDAGYNAATVAHVIKMVDRAEYKRRQYPPGVKITPLAFGRDRRMPITNAFSR